MAITLDSNTTDISTSGSPVSFSFTNSAGTFLVAMFAIRANDTAISSPTYNGVSLTSANVRATNADGERSEIWYLASPATGSNTFQYTKDTTEGGSTNDDVRCVLTTWTEAVGFDLGNTNTGSTGAGDVSVTPTNDDSLIVACLSHEDGSAPSTGSGETTIENNDEGTWSTGFIYNVQTTATSQSMNWTGTDDQWAASAAVFHPTLAVSTNDTRAAKLSGVGITNDTRTPRLYGGYDNTFSDTLDSTTYKDTGNTTAGWSGDGVIDYS